MRGLEIYDGIGKTGGLNFDLADILAALGQLVHNSSWRIRDLHYLSRDEQDIPLLHAASDPGPPMTSSELLKASEGVLQIIDGEFEATRSGETVPWLRVRAIDSSLWTVHSTDPNALAAIRARFADVQDADEVPQN